MVLGTLLLPGPITINDITFDTNTLLLASMSILIGVNLITFGIFSKVFATSVGFLPKDHLFEKTMARGSLEMGIVIGVVACLLGTGLLALGVWQWHLQEYGPLSYPRSLRLIIPGTTALTLGIEIIFSSFLMSLFLMSRK